mmetsp:Transcript_40443/g.108596  ORF Transcript_40443/g.108596 Transcript_40443/m.108596 type:complete len:142 (+) Transcript_40443:406-831(+)
MEKMNPLTGRLQVTVESARGLPRLDFTGKLDPYCLVFLCGDSVNSLPYTCEPARTTTKYRSVTPVWHEELPEMEVTPADRHLVVMVFDEDMATPNELVGCAVTELDNLHEDGTQHGLDMELLRPNGSGWTTGVPRVRACLG